MSSASSPTSPVVPGGFGGRQGSGDHYLERNTASTSSQGQAAGKPDTWAAGAEELVGDGEKKNDRRRDDRIKSRFVDTSGWNWEESQTSATHDGPSSMRIHPSMQHSSQSQQQQQQQQQQPQRTASLGADQRTNGDGPQSGSMTEFRRPSFPTRTSSRPDMARIDTSGRISPAGNRSGAPSPSGQLQAAPALASSSAATFPANSEPFDRPPQDLSQQPQSQTQAGTSKEVGTSKSKRDQPCDACGKPMTGQFVRALGVVYHLDCFRCRDCNKVVAAKFFPATDEMSVSSPAGSGSNDGDRRQPSPTGKLFPLCETDYFRRLDLICAKCGGALRGSYITALGKKFHVEHFTCSVCPVVFGPQDSYYEHDGRVFCHFHYSTRFAIRCTGCQTAILKQFVEINRNNQDEHWHPECYMIHKFWNIKLCPTGSTPRENVAAEPTTVPSAPEPSNSGVAPVSNASATDAPSADALETEASETPSSLKHKQRQMEEQVYRIWTVLSAFEESSAACISEMLRHVSSGRYLGGVRMAERFILHVEILFSAIDDLEKEFRKEQAKGISHIREARMLCKKIVNFFSLLSHTQETGAQRMGITQELLSLVTGLAHYLKILIRIALTGALKLDREFDNHHAIGNFLSKLASLAREGVSSSDDKPASNLSSSSGGDLTNGSKPGELPYGYLSLPRSTSTSLSEGGEGATDLCVSCGQTVEEDCVRMGINMRWHNTCMRCKTCRRPVYRDPSTSSRSKQQQEAAEAASDAPPALPANQFSLEIIRRPAEPGSSTNGSARYHASSTYSPYCPECCTANARPGFENVSRLEQYAFLLRVALNRLYALLKKRGVVPASPPPNESNDLPLVTEAADSQTSNDAHDSYRDSQDIKRMKSVNLDRKLSTKAKVPHLSTVVGSPSGRQTTATSVQRTSPTEMTGDYARPGGLTRSPSPRQASPVDQESGDRLSAGRPISPGVSPGRQGSRELSPTRQGRGPQRSPPPPPPPPHAPYHQQQQYQQQQQQQQQQQPSMSGTQQGPIIPIRPAFARHNTDVRIRDEGPVRQPSGDEAQRTRSMDHHQDDGLTLADIPQLLEAEQAREQHRSLPSEGGRSLSELSALELFIVKHMAVMLLQQTSLKDMVPFDDLIEFIEMRKNTFWGKLFKGGKDKKKIEKKGVFGIPLEILVERSGADSTLGASATHLRVPSFIDDIISSMKQMDVSIEGIFRKNGNIRRLKELSEALDRDSTSVNFLDDNPVQLAALLKKWLRELPDPLLTFKLHKLFVMSQKLEPESERIRCLQMVSVLLPKAHRDTMEVLFVFLKWVASFSHIDEETGSKMDLQNLATVLGPNILYAKGADPAKDELFLANRAILAILENQDDFWTVPVELEAVLQDRELLNSSAELTSRDILRRCEKYAKRVRTTAATPRFVHPGGGSSGNRHMPDVHGPATMRQVDHYARGQGGGGGPGGYSRSPIEGSGMPWMQQPQGGSQHYAYGSSPDRNNSNHFYAQQQQHQQQQAVARGSSGPPYGAGNHGHPPPNRSGSGTPGLPPPPPLNNDEYAPQHRMLDQRST